MAYSLEAAAEIYREALRDRVRRYALLYICEGVLLALAGVLAIIYPLVSSAAIGVPLGWLLIATAAVQAIILFGLRALPHFGFQLISVAVTVLVGVLLLRDPQQALQTITLLIMFFLVLQGVSRLVFGLTIRPFEGWLWVAASGVFGIFLSIVLLVNLPDPAAWLVGLLVGLELIGEGAAIAFLAWPLRFGAARQTPVDEQSTDAKH
jgi:uncharacterized membrane protein HdeD (DUF308 family)